MVQESTFLNVCTWVSTLVFYKLWLSRKSSEPCVKWRHKTRQKEFIIHHSGWWLPLTSNWPFTVKLLIVDAAAIKTEIAILFQNSSTEEHQLAIGQPESPPPSYFTLFRRHSVPDGRAYFHRPSWSYWTVKKMY